MSDKVVSEQKTETKKDLWIIYSGMGGGWVGRVVKETPQNYILAEGHRIPKSKVLCWDISTEQVVAFRDLKARQRGDAERLRLAQKKEINDFIMALNHEI